MADVGADPSADQAADDASDEGAGDDEAEEGIGGVGLGGVGEIGEAGIDEVGFEAVDRAIDHGGVIPEEQTPEGGDEGEEDDVRVQFEHGFLEVIRSR
jgi:hypothetical protein